MIVHLQHLRGKAECMTVRAWQVEVTRGLQGTVSASSVCGYGDKRRPKQLIFL